MLCKRCVLSDQSPDVRLDTSGTCNICSRDERATTRKPGAEPKESDFVRILNKYKSKGDYDCMVMVSGGKDSIAALTFMKERFRMNPLAFTFDQGFGQPEGLANVEHAVKELDVDWLALRSDYMRELFAEVIKSNVPVPICPLCSLWYFRLTYETAARFGIKLIITGWTRGQLNTAQGPHQTPEGEFPTMTRATQDFIKKIRKKYPQYKDFPLRMKDVRKKHKKAVVLSPHWFLRYDKAEYSEMIRKRFGWKPVTHSYPVGSVNCFLNFVAAYHSNKHYGFNHHHLEESQLIRIGEETREEALSALQVDIEAEPTRSVVEDVLEKLGCSWNELTA